jgi:DNA-binding NarL/FixJ family response regulator
MKRVFMLSSQLLLSEGVEDLLREQSKLEIVGKEMDLTKAIQKIHRLQPDVVFVDSKDLESMPSSTIARILKVAPCAKVIAINLLDDQILILRGEQRAARSVEDLMQVIEDENL